jgi:predicted 2-oxoglutarate/Fe(II)-dependent dioxygenase YbiX
MHEMAFRSISPNVDDYGRYWGVGVNFFEAFNFVKYDGAGTHFKIHADHGPAYVTTISVVAFPNEGYEGGELYFPRFNLTLKPKKGDVVVFPSTYIYEHASNDMISGTKYSIVIMTDYNDRGGLRNFNYRQEDMNRLTY